MDHHILDSHPHPILIYLWQVPPSPEPLLIEDSQQASLDIQYCLAQVHLGQTLTYSQENPDQQTANQASPLKSHRLA
jgi:hypothetical protein